VTLRLPVSSAVETLIDEYFSFLLQQWLQGSLTPRNDGTIRQPGQLNEDAGPLRRSLQQ
jgi:hypothetical protein